MLINLISQIPIIPIDGSPQSLVQKNQITLAVGLILYLLLLAGIYLKKVPEALLNMLPSQNFLLLIIALDFTLFFVIHRFMYGIFPPLTLSQLPPPPKQKRQLAPPKSKKKSPPSNPGKNQQHHFEESIADQELEIADDLESALKRPKQPDFEEISVSPDKFFDEAESQAPTVENWNLDEYSQEDMIPDDQD